MTVQHEFLAHLVALLLNTSCAQRQKSLVDHSPLSSVAGTECRCVYCRESSGNQC